jgi:prephenate dehydrogenase
MENKEFLLDELSILQQNLSEYSSAIESGDSARLKRLLEDGVRCKEMVDSE